MAKRDQKPTITLPQGGRGPHIAPGVSQAGADRALAYAAGMNARRLGELPKANVPRAGGPGPSIPHLAGAPGSDGQPQTMEQYARQERGGGQPMAGGIIQPGGPPTAPVNTALADLDIRPSDLLTEQATSDPEFVAGQGAMYAAAQPHLAAKYGVVRGNQVIPPQRLRLQQSQAQLRPETVQGLQDLVELQKSAGGPPKEKKEPIDPSSSASAAATVGNAVGDRDPTPLTEQEQQDLKDAMRNVDEFQLSQWRQAMMKDILNSEEQRKIIEGRLEELDITDLLVAGTIKQRIPIVPGKFEITLQSYDGVHDLALKRLIMEEGRSANVSEQYLLDKYSLYGVALQLHKINDKVYPDCIDEEGKFDDDRFLAKFDKVVRLNIHVLASVGVNILWFEQRVRKLCKAENLGNG